MEPTMIDAEINGLILWHEAAQAVRVERSLLMLDAVSWARWISAKKRGEAGSPSVRVGLLRNLFSGRIEESPRARRFR